MLRRIAVALAVAGVLALGMVLALRKQDREERQQRAEARLPLFDDRQVTGLTLQTRRGAWRVAREGSEWRVVAPVEDAADPKAVEAVIGAARKSRGLQTIDAPEALAAYGLGPPGATLTLEGGRGPPPSVGEVAPTGDAIFARVEGRPGVLLLPAAEATSLTAEPSSLRDRSIVGLARGEVDGIELEPGGIRLARSPEGWWIEKPVRHPAAAE